MVADRGRNSASHREGLLGQAELHGVALILALMASPPPSESGGDETSTRLTALVACLRRGV